MSSSVWGCQVPNPWHHDVHFITKCLMLEVIEFISCSTVLLIFEILTISWPNFISQQTCTTFAGFTIKINKAKGSGNFCQKP